MKGYSFILFIFPIALLAQNQEMQTNGATDCPTFGKKNVTSKASMFQYMRTHKPQRTQPKEEQVYPYKSSALPDLQQAAQARQAALKEKEVQKEPKQKKKRPRREEPAVTPESTIEVAVANPQKEPATVTPPIKDDLTDEEIHTSDRKDDPEKEKGVSEAREKRDKKARKAARKSKTQRLFKRTNKPTSRKHVEKCPSF